MARVKRQPKSPESSRPMTPKGGWHLPGKGASHLFGSAVGLFLVRGVKSPVTRVGAAAGMARAVDFVEKSPTNVCPNTSHHPASLPPRRRLAPTVQRQRAEHRPP